MFNLSVVNIIMLDDNAQENWQSVLEDLNLTLVIEESNV